MSAARQASLNFSIRKKASASRRKITKEADDAEQEKENSPTKKLQLEAVTSPTKGTKVLRHRPVETLISRLDLLAPLNGVNYKKTKQALHTSIPNSLVGREAESEEVDRFLRDHVEAGKPGSIYISGAPGTGKTAVLKKAIESLKTPHIEIFINCMTHKNSHSIFTAIRLSLTCSKSAATKGTEYEGDDTEDEDVRSLASSKSSKSSAKAVLAEIEDIVTSSSKPILLICDEIDSLDSRNQEVLYTIFEWPALDQSKLTLVGISNSLDLTDRILPRLQAREKYKPQLINFAPYSREEIAKIIMGRVSKLEEESALESAAVQFCARKVSSMSGDLRLALDICRRAVELVEMEERKPNSSAVGSALTTNNEEVAVPKVPTNGKKVNIATILKVFNEVYSQKVLMKGETQMTIPLQQMLAVCTLLMMVKKSKASKEVTLGKLQENYAKVCKKNGVSGTDQSEFLALCTSLEDRGIMAVKKSKVIRNYKMSLRVDEKELESVIQDKTLFSSILIKGLD